MRMVILIVSSASSGQNREQPDLPGKSGTQTGRCPAKIPVVRRVPLAQLHPRKLCSPPSIDLDLHLENQSTTQPHFPLILLTPRVVPNHRHLSGLRARMHACQVAPPAKILRREKL